MLSVNSQLFLSLVKLGIGHNTLCTVISQEGKYPSFGEWNEIQDIALRQGLYAVVLDGIEEVRCKKAEGKFDVKIPPQELMLQWIGEVLQEYEARYKEYVKTIGEMAEFYNFHGYKMMVLKGYACSLDWPRPEHRPCGDIDIWQFGKQKEADLSVTKEKGIEIDNSHHHHTVSSWGDFSIENHYDFINVHHHKSHIKLEKILKELAADDSHYVEMKGGSVGDATEKVYLPSPNLHALFLMKHLMLHFSTGEITLRQVLDWAFFVEKHGKDVDWNKMLLIYDEYHMREFFNCINAICVEELGFKTSVFPYIQFDPSVKERVMDDILNPRFQGEKPSNILFRIVWKIRRWKANEWKHKLCYEESMWSAFWSGVWGHLLKPASI